MEGCDGTADGTPGELTKRRYMRFARSGAGLIWFEAVAVVPEGRGNPRQLMLTESNLEYYKRLVSAIKEESLRECGFEPLIIMQETHSGRYSRPKKHTAYRHPVIEKDGADENAVIVTDNYLEGLEQSYADSARLAQRAGFDGADIKACHGYLLNELLSGRERPGRYGGSLKTAPGFS
jgi:2,4-dienoyl-CoA reductase-like NADH-dependent reductase (Old Yellow Enzyme family)